MKPKLDTRPQEQQQPIKLSVNTVFNGAFYKAGDPLPVSSADDLPPSLQPFVMTGGEPEEAEELARANYQLGVVYSVDSDGRLGRAIARQVAQLEAQAEQEAWAEEQLSAPLAPEIAEALQAQNDAHISASKARAQYAAEERDRAQEIAQKFIDGEDQEVNEL